MITELIDTFDNLTYGIPIALVITLLMMLVVKATNDKKRFNALSYLIALVVCVLLTYQMSRLVGACRLSDRTEQITGLVEMVSPSLSQYIPAFTGHDLGWFIFRRVVWSLVYLVIGAISIIVTMDRQYRRSNRPDGFRTDRRYPRANTRR